MADKIHYRMSPSAMERILECPGSARDDLPEESSEAADRGTLGHAWVNHGLGGDDFPDQPLTEDLVEPVQECIEYVRDQPVRFTRHLEQTIVHQSIEDFGGTCDVVLVSEVELEVIDFKFGDWAVSVEDNKQLLSYLVLARDRFGARERYAYHVVQPAVGPPRRVEVSGEELNRHALAVIAAGGDSTLRAGAHCRWCPLAMACEERRRWTNGVGASVFDETTSIETYLEVLQAAPVIAKLEEEAKKELLKLALGGQDIPGYRVGKSLTNWQWVDNEQVAREFGDYAYESILRSPTAMAEEHHAHVGGTKKAAREFVNSLCERKVRGPILVTLDSPAPAWDYVDGSVFDE
jgi:hypothetical protein